MHFGTSQNTKMKNESGMERERERVFVLFLLLLSELSSWVCLKFKILQLDTQRYQAYCILTVRNSRTEAKILHGELLLRHQEVWNSLLSRYASGSLSIYHKFLGKALASQCSIEFSLASFIALLFKSSSN